MPYKNKIERLIYHKVYYQKHKKELSKKAKQYSKLHKKEIAIRIKKWYIKNKNKYNSYKKEWYIKNKKRILQLRKDYRLKNKIKINKYLNKKRELDVNFRLSHNLRNRIIKVLKGINKSKSTFKLLGCKLNQLKIHLEKQFRSGMSWANYGKWHIDHIRPCASFDLSKSSEQRKCFHYSNLQPLWKKDNLEKRDKI